ncbi:MAG: hypothetical protein R3C68_14575 [Myxococcota bacterium]
MATPRRQESAVSSAFLAPPSGNGSEAKPWDLRTALGHPAALQPGDTIWIHGGRYTGNHVSELVGATGAPITIRSAPGQWAVLDGDGASGVVLKVSGAHTIYRDFEVTSSDASRPNSWNQL